MSTTLVKSLWRSPTVRVVSGLAGGNLLGMVIGIIGTLVQARFVDKEDLGYFRQFAIVTGYAFFLQLGVLGTFQRLYPYYIGKGQKDRAIAVAEVAQAWNVGATLLVSGTFVALAAVTMAQGNWKASLGWLVQAIAMAGFIYGGYLGATYRSGHDFTRLAKSGVFASIGGLFVLPLFVLWPYVAMAVRGGIVGMINLSYLHLFRPLKIAWRFNWTEWLRLVKEGMPMFIAGYGATTGWSIVETTIILKDLGTGALGLWTMSFMVLEAANKIPNAMTAVYTPRVTEEFGRTESVAACLRMCRRPMLWGATSMLGLAAVGSAALWFIVPMVMPMYQAALPSMFLMLLYLPVLVLEMPYVLLIAMGKIVEQNVVTYVGLGVFAVAATVALRMDCGLNAVIAASLGGRLVRLGLMYAFLRHFKRKSVHAVVDPAGNAPVPSTMEA